MSTLKTPREAPGSHTAGGRPNGKDGATCPGTAPADIWSDRLLRIVHGEATSADIERWVNTSWREGHFVEVVSGELIQALPSAGRPVARYGDSGVLRSEVCFQYASGPGGVVVHTPAMDVWSDDRANYCVAPHVHGSAHVTVVLQGEAYFFITRDAAHVAGVTQIAVGPGCILLCPAGIAHSFGSIRGAFVVLSIQARFVEPSQPEFARTVSTFNGRPIVRTELPAS